MTHSSAYSLRSTLLSWAILTALFFWFKGGYLPVVVAVAGALLLWIGSVIAPRALSLIAVLYPGKLTILLATIAICAVIGEIVITSIAPQMQVYGWLSRDTYEISPTRWFAHKPNLDVELSVPDYTYRLQTNSLGFRDTEHAKQKQQGVIRVLLAGDSFTDGDGVAVEDNYPSVMRRALEEDSARWEVINVSVPGYGPVETALTVSEYASQYKPDLIIFGFYLGNDLADAMKTRDEKLREIGLIHDTVPLFPLNRWLWHNSNLYVLLQNTVSVLREKVRGGPTRRQLGLTGVRYFETSAPQVFNRGWRETVKALANMKQIAGSVGSDFIAALFPLASQVTPSQFLKYVPRELNLRDTTRYDLDWLQRSLHQKLDSLEIAYTDLTPVFRDAKEQPLFNALADHHPNKDGYRLIGETVAQAALEWRKNKQR